VASAEAQPESTRNFGKQAATMNEHSAADAATEDDNRKRTQRTQRGKAATNAERGRSSVRSGCEAKGQWNWFRCPLAGYALRRILAAREDSDGLQYKEI
jgi:hypothetical protein